jgi:hypothetical protein
MMIDKRLPGRCPVCGKRDNKTAIIGGVSMYTCNQHFSFWPVPSTPEDQPPLNWFAGLWQDKQVNR